MRNNSVSFEFFPPKTLEGRQKLRETRKQLAQFNPEFFSVTFGAGGTTREGTRDTVLEINREGHMAAPHLSCIGTSKESLRLILDEYVDHGVRQLVALRGDMPSGMVAAGDFRYANELVSFVRAEYGDQFRIEVAAYPEFHPQARSAEDDISNFVRKVQAGADSAITQYFFNADSYFRFVEVIQARGITIPITPGIMPIANFSQLCRFSDMCGAEVPRWLRWRMQAYSDDTASIRALGLDIVTELCDRLLEQGAPGIHFYTLNQAGLISTICQRLGW